MAVVTPDMPEIFEEAYERAGLEMRSGYDLKTARRSLNLLTLEWQNRGLNLFTIKVPTIRNYLQIICLDSRTCLPGHLAQLSAVTHIIGDFMGND